MSRIMGEAALLVVVGAAALVLFDPEPLAGLTGGTNFTVIPIQITLDVRTRARGHSMAAAASITSTALAAMNSVAIIREHFRRRLNP